MTKIASSPTLDGLTKHLNAYWCSNSVEILPSENPKIWPVKSSNRIVSNVEICKIKRGFLAYHPEKKVSQ